MALSQVEKIVKIYKTVAQNPSLTGAKIIDVNKKIIINSLWSQRNLERKCNQKFMQTHTLEKNENQFDHKLMSSSFSIDVTSELTSSYTNDNQYRAVLRQANVENTSKQFIEIWDKNCLLKNYDLNALDVHGDVYTDSEFGTFEWSPDNTKLLYIAEKKLPKSEPFYKQKSKKETEKETDKKNESETIIGNEYLYKPTWGEQLVGKHHPVIAILDTENDKISIISEIPDDLSPGQVIWSSDGSSIIGVAWKHEPRYLGLMFCTNRFSWIFEVKDGKYRNLSKDGCAVRCPRISPNGKHLVWLERDVIQSGSHNTGPHHNAHRLMHMDFDSENREIKVLHDIVKRSVLINNGNTFTGLYGRLPQHCWSNNSQYLLFSTPQQSNVRSYIFNLESSTITEIKNNESSLVILDIKDDIIAFLKTSLTSPSNLVVGSLKSIVEKSGIIELDEITSPLQIPGFENFIYENTEYVYDNDESIKQFNFTYFGPKEGPKKSVPLLITPHGGPHSSFANLFSFEHSVFALLGFAIVQVNYRGSIGMGSENVEYLQGRIGKADVQDCVTATKEALKKYEFLNPDQVVLSGGSHGGFLVTHLSGQFPDMYKAVISRNPVIDLASMFTTSDIPDWCSAESDCPYPGVVTDKKNINYKEMLMKMFESSPIVHVENVRAPTLLCIGENDLRVNPFQGKLWYNRLKANNVKTKMLVYEDNHSLSSATAEIDNIINSCLWLTEHVLEKQND